MTLVLSGIMENDKRNPKGIAMPDIALRLNKDMLVLSAPLDARLQDQGFDIEKDAAYLALFEPDSVRDALRMELLAGATCLVANTASITPARLTHLSMEDRADEFVEASLAVAHELNPQHVLVEIAPCGLPLDASSKASLNENRSQYARAVRTFANRELDAFFLNGFTTCDDLKCALMGVRQASDMPVFASVDVLPSGTLSSGRGTLAKAVSVMEEYGATVAGFNTGAQAQDAVRLANEAAAACDLPLLVQLHVAERNPRQGVPTEENPYYCPDAMVGVAVQLRGAGVQFLRATGAATPAYTGALAAAVTGYDVTPSAAEKQEKEEAPGSLEDLVAAARAKIAAAMGKES